jgi:F0F1-type ATP synthase assembly protein I
MTGSGFTGMNMRSRAKRDQPGWGQYFSTSALGIEVGVALAIGMGIGWWLDKLFHTQPWLLVIFTGFGIAAGFRNLIKSSREKMRAAEGDGGSDKRNSR